MAEYFPVLLMFVVATLFAAGFLGLSWLVGPKKPTKSKLDVYECGVPTVGSARDRFSVKFYLVALLFILFDVEVVFLYPWAINFKEAIANGDGLYYLFIMGEFFLMLMLGLVFAWRKGALDWAKAK